MSVLHEYGKQVFPLKKKEYGKPVLSGIFSVMHAPDSSPLRIHQPHIREFKFSMTKILNSLFLHSYSVQARKTFFFSDFLNDDPPTKGYLSLHTNYNEEKEAEMIG